MKNLKKVVFGLVALIVAFGLVFSVSAFKASNKPHHRATYTFYYNGPLPADKNDVENPSNWKYDENTEECDNEPEMACSITVSDTYVDDTGDEPVLESSINLQAQDHTILPAAFVTGSADNSMQIINRTY